MQAIYIKPEAAAWGHIALIMLHKMACRGPTQTVAYCSLRSRRDMYFKIFEIEITRNADIEPRVCASPDFEAFFDH